jgi:hypothetical protein
MSDFFLAAAAFSIIPALMLIARVYVVDTTTL